MTSTLRGEDGGVHQTVATVQQQSDAILMSDKGLPPEHTGEPKQQQQQRQRQQHHIPALSVNAGSHVIRRVAEDGSDSGTGTPFFAYPKNTETQSALSLHRHDNSNATTTLVVKPGSDHAEASLPETDRRLYFVKR